jgi:hypothetical protein
MIEERFDDFPIDELQDGGPLIDQSDIRPQGRHEGCVFETHDTGTGNNDFFRDAA